MADLKPFRAIRYRNSENLDACVTPPYDVISAEQQQAYYDQDPHNFIRIDLGLDRENDAPGSDKYTRARQTIFDWISDGVLSIDEPSVYRHEQTFADETGSVVTRRGFFATIRLADYEEKVVLPHERTLKGPKIDRLNLMKETECHLSPVFFLYDDPDSQVDKTLADNSDEPLADITTADGIRHILWRVTDPAAIATVQEVFKPQPVLIADGHHRYETALAYRAHRREQAIEHHGDAAYEFTLGFFVNHRDPGLAVFGTHRAMYGLEGLNFDDFKNTLNDEPDFNVSDAPADATALISALADAGGKGPSFAVSSEGKTTFIATYVGGVDSPRFDDETPDEVRELDVAILHEGIIDRLLGVDRAAQEAKTNISYIKGFQDAVDAAQTSKYDVVFLMNPTKVSQVDKVCRSGGKMPQKSTYFYPKVLSGLLINPA